MRTEVMRAVWANIIGGKRMDREEKFLDPEYLSTRVRDFKEIKRVDLEFKVVRSCNYP